MRARIFRLFKYVKGIYYLTYHTATYVKVKYRDYVYVT